MIKDKFFSAEEIKTGVWQITNCFNSHARMNTFCYLVEGETRALVIDTMYGYGDLAAFCRALTDKPRVKEETRQLVLKTSAICTRSIFPSCSTPCAARRRTRRRTVRQDSIR